MSLSDINTEFLDTVEFYKTLKNSARDWENIPWENIFKGPCPPGEKIEVPVFTKANMISIVAYSFLKIYAAWESFLEETFIAYLMGEEAPNGNRATPLLDTPINKEDAREYLKDPTESYSVNWALPERIDSRAKRLFENGWLYSPMVRSYNYKLNELRMLRNAIAHSLFGTNEDFKKIIRRELVQYPPTGLLVGEFLNMIKKESGRVTTYFDKYINLLIFISEAVIPN